MTLVVLERAISFKESGSLLHAVRNCYELFEEAARMVASKSRLEQWHEHVRSK